MEGEDASQLLMVIDACNSGQASKAEEKRRGPMNSKGLAQLAYEKGMSVLTAAQGYQAALESSQLGHGYLTYALVEEGFQTTAADATPKDNLVIVREWFDFAAERVPQMQEAKMASRGLNVGGQLLRLEIRKRRLRSTRASATCSVARVLPSRTGTATLHCR